MENKQDTTQQEMLEMIRFIHDHAATKEDIDLVRHDMATKDDIAGVRRDMATKDDISNMATKDDISNMATKDDIAGVRRDMATKDDISNMATKDDIAGVRRDMATKDDIGDVRKEIRELHNEMMEHVDGFIGLYRKHEAELAAVVSRQERLEENQNHLTDKLNAVIQHLGLKLA